MTGTSLSYDRYSLPGEIPDDPCGSPREGGDLGDSGGPDDTLRSPPSRGLAQVPTQDWLSRGLRHPAGRGWDYDDDMSPRGGGDLGDPGWAPDTLRSPPARGLARAPEPFPNGWEPGDLPVKLDVGLGGDPFAHARKFDRAMRTQFLDFLATCGEVRSAALRVGVSRETCYRARRRHPDFARLWDAALVHARARAASELATMAMDGVPVPVFVRGEHVATWRRIDARLVLAHIARLERHAESNPAAVAAAGRFDELLARHAGHPELAGSAEAAAACRDRDARRMLAGVPATRDEYVRHARGQALEALDLTEQDFADDEDPADALAEAEHAIYEDAAGEAAAEWDAHAEAGFARLDAIIHPCADGEGDHAPPRDGGVADVPQEQRDHACPEQSRGAQQGGGESAPPTDPDSAPPREYKSRQLGLARSGRKRLEPCHICQHPAFTQAFTARRSAQHNNYLGPR